MNIEHLKNQITKLTGLDIVSCEAMGGCEPSRFYLVEFEDDTTLGCKQNHLAKLEADMLRTIGEFCDAAVPVHVSDEFFMHPFLVKEPPTSGHWIKFGASIRNLHAHVGPSYGWRDNYAFDTVKIQNSPSDSWPTFWGGNRLACLLEGLPISMAGRIKALIDDLPNLLPQTPKASLLHGDLWAGNVVFCQGSAHLIDPAAYYGHAEVDLAMLNFFDPPNDAFWDGYGATEDGYEQRQPIYQMWPALVHFHLFGKGYLPMLDRLLSETGH